MNIALWGDLKYGRTIHSLIFALAKFGANILFCPSPGLEVPEHVTQKLIAEYGGDVENMTAEQKAKTGRFPLNAIYTTPNQPHQLAMMPGVDIELELKTGLDALYVTRPQKERFTASEQQAKNDYPVVDKELLKEKSLRRAMVMHPLPRVDELAYELDSDPRSLYFKQAAQGVPVRMALVSLLLGMKDTAISENRRIFKVAEYPVYKQDTGIKCPNPKCVSIQATETRYLKPEFKIVSFKPLTLRCSYCEHGFEPKYVASTEWHEGMLVSKKYHQASSHWSQHIKPENLLIFNSVENAEAAGFKADLKVKQIKGDEKAGG